MGKEKYDTLQKLLLVFKYNDVKWKTCSNQKVISILLGRQQGYTKYSPFIYEWDIRANDKHYCIQTYTSRQYLEPGDKNVVNRPLVASADILLQPLHIKLQLIKCFAKVLNWEVKTFVFIRNFFFSISDAKIKESVFVDPDVREIMKNEQFESILRTVEKDGFHSRTLYIISYGIIKLQTTQCIVQNM